VRAAGWTGGQYSLVRVGFAACLGVALASSSEIGLSTIVALVAAAFLAAGLVSTAPALILAALLASGLIGIADPTLRWAGIAWLLLHAALPAGPYGSLAARRNEDPGTWEMPSWLPTLAWSLFLASRVALGASAIAHGRPGLGLVLLLVAGLSLLPGLRPATWSFSLGLDLVRFVVGDLPLGGSAIVHALAFRPDWLTPRSPHAEATVFYDGTCALCHGAVRFLLAEDPPPGHFRIAPLGGATSDDAFENTASLPDSIVVAPGDGRLLVRSDAVIHCLDALGGWWRVAAAALAGLPRPLRDAAYDVVARRRRSWFGTIDPVACSLPPPRHRVRFDP
jgi:predicted DCC family thiol-disulfide oxidoreductase YuxK